MALLKEKLESRKSIDILNSGLIKINEFNKR